jgi:hypothetical protein
MSESPEVREIYVELDPSDIAYVKFIIESYEILGILRTVDPTKAIVVVLAVPDTERLTEEVLAGLEREISLKRIPRPDDIGDDWLLKELEQP